MATTAEILVDTLMDWGVDTIFGLPGDGINGIMEALRTRREHVRFIQVRHEEAAAFMACGYAKYTGKLGVCLATSGPGGIHLLNGLYDAKLDGQPVLAITGHHYHDLIDTHAQQDVDLDRVFEDVSVYTARIMGPAHVENVATLACRTAVAYRGVAHINFPVDLQEQEGGERSPRNLPGHASDVYTRGRGLPDETDLRRAAEILNAGKKIVILAGQGALGAIDELERLAETLAAPVVKALLGKAALPDDSPYTTGPVGLLGSRPSQEALEQCDTLLLIGTSFPYIEFYPKPGQARGIQIDLDPVRIGLRYPIEVGLVGDTKRTIQAILPLLRRHEARAFLARAQEGMKQWRALMEEQAARRDLPMKPQVVAQELGKRLASTAIVQVAYPDRQCVGFVGDGGFSMLMAEFATAVKYELPIKIVVIKNNTLGQIKWEQMVFLGNPEYGCDLHPIDFVAFARACGGTGFRIEDPADCGSVRDEALGTPGPALIEAVVDPFEPPMPPKVTAKQAVKFARSLARGEPNRAKIALTVLEDKVRELL
jgi:pyruvate dehydrogenase (quinone)/pyruvate oxidase